MLLLAVFLAGCSTDYYRKSADRQVYGIIRSKSPLVPNMEPHFTIEQTNEISLEGLPIATNVPECLGPDGEAERGARILKLKDSLAIAVKTSRKYQTEKEDLYLSALSLTLARHAFTPIFSALGQARYRVDELTDDSSLSDNIVEERQLQANGTIRMDWLMGSVGKLSTAFSKDFFRFFTGDRSLVTSSELSATFLRPLLRNAGFKAEREALTQAERNLLYELRDFTRFRKSFSVEVATAYYGVLGRRDMVRNNFLNLQSSRQNAERGRALAQEGRITQSDLGRYEQQVLTAESTWINAVRSYKQDLDNFKYLIGLSLDVNVVLDDRELESLQILDPNLSLEDSIRIALGARFDYLNAKDRFEDAERVVALDANLLKPTVDFDAKVRVESARASKAAIIWPEPSHYSWDAGLTVDPGLDRLEQRNTYRAALITRNRAARNVVQQEDDIRIEVRDSWRTLDQAKRNFEISEVGVKLAERRVEEQNLLAELGRAKALDQVDAQNALVDSKNQRTQALVIHTNARLLFWNRLGILYIKDNGQWERTQDAKAQ